MGGAKRNSLRSRRIPADCNALTTAAEVFRDGFVRTQAASCGISFQIVRLRSCFAKRTVTRSKDPANARNDVVALKSSHCVRFCPATLPCPGLNVGMPFHGFLIKCSLGSFDSVAAWLRQAATPLRMTNFKCEGIQKDRHYAVFFRTSAEFFEPNPTQLQMACSIDALRPTSGT